MPDIALVLFDFNGVLSRYQRQKRIAALATLAHRPDAAIEAAIFESGIHDEGMRARLMPRYIFTGLAR